jgi:hypothetical protein
MPCGSAGSKVTWRLAPGVRVRSISPHTPIRLSSTKHPPSHSCGKHQLLQRSADLLSAQTARIVGVEHLPEAVSFKVAGHAAGAITHTAGPERDSRRTKRRPRRVAWAEEQIDGLPNGPKDIHAAPRPPHAPAQSLHPRNAAAAALSLSPGRAAGGGTRGRARQEARDYAPCQCCMAHSLRPHATPTR